MKKAFNLEVGDKAIYRCGYALKESYKVDEPIDDEERPKFLIGRVDLANGDYITNGTIVYDSKEEAISDMEKSINERIDVIKSSIEAFNIELNMLDRLKEKIKKN